METGLEQLLAEGVVSEVLARLQSGKEAEVYVVRFGGKVVAAKVYKDRATRSFKNNADYKEGRAVRNSRSARAIASGSRFGKAAAEDAWKASEADALYKLHDANVRVPTPVLYLDGVLLMELVLDETGNPARRLIDTGMTVSQANEGYHDMIGQLVRILACDLIHGDLSPYNVLAAVAGPTVIDFPQIISASHNSSSERFFRRDAENILGHFASVDRSLHARHGDVGEIWRAYVSRELTPEFRPTGRYQPARAVQPPARSAVASSGPRSPRDGHGRGNDGGDSRGANASSGHAGGRMGHGHGANGSQRPNSSQLPSGASGSQHPNNTYDANGSQRTSGANGSQRTSGANGSQRTSGTNSSQRTSGANGNQRPNGANGNQRPNGANGNQRPNGANGSQRPGGAFDANGSQRTSGTSGANSSQRTNDANGRRGGHGGGPRRPGHAPEVIVVQRRSFIVHPPGSPSPLVVNPSTPSADPSATSSAHASSPRSSNHARSAAPPSPPPPSHHPARSTPSSPPWSSGPPRASHASRPSDDRPIATSSEDAERPSHRRRRRRH